MVIRVDRLIYVYLALCACLLLFNLAYTGRRRVSDIRNPFKTRMWRDYLEKSTEQKKLTDKQIRELTRKLSRVSGLEAFQETIEKFREEGHKEIDPWIENVRPVFIRIGSRYLKRGVMEEAYYAYAVWQNKLCGNSEQDALVRYMLQLIREHSIYCRENALKALYEAGSSELVVKAFKIMQRHSIEHSQKLVTDGLAAFTGNKEELGEYFLREWATFSPYYQTAFINFMRLSSGSFGERLLKLLETPETDREVKFAVIRYLRRYRFEPAAPCLQKLVRNWDADDWEFPALAASALENYPSDETIRTLYEGLHSTSWYVRSNASDSILKVAGEENVMNELFLRSDKYALDMLRYKIERRKEGCRNDGCN